MRTKLLIAFALFALLLVGKLNAQFSGGSGTEADPYRITSREDLEALADSVMFAKYTGAVFSPKINWSYDKHFKLMKDITDSVKRSIGGVYRVFTDTTFDYEEFPFQGSFDGQNYKITLAMDGSYINKDGYRLYSSSLFFSVEPPYLSFMHCIIKNVVVDGYAATGIINGVVTLNLGNMGRGKITISNCVNNANINATHEWVGGIVGSVQNYGEVIIENCINNGNITAPEYCVGGIVGHCSGDKEGIVQVSNCINTGKITGDTMVGGIIGHFLYNGTISNCLNIGTASGKSAGGIVGEVTETGGNISNCINAGLVIGVDEVGGIVGTLTNISDNRESKLNISNCLNTGVIFGLSPDTYRGGIVGYEENNTIITNCYYDKQMCIYGGIAGTDVAGRAEGLLTNEMTGTALQAKLGGAFTYSDICNNLYPMLTALSSHTASQVGRSPAFLCSETANFDRQNNVRSHFYVSTANNVVWTNTLNAVSISGSDATLDRVGSFDTLEAKIGTYKKQIPIITGTSIRACATSPQSFYTLTVNTTAGGTTDPSGSQLVACGESREIRAFASDCYRFLKWQNIRGDSISNENPLLVMVSSDTILLAIFEPANNYNLTLGKNPENVGTVTGAGTYGCNAEATIEAIPNECYVFKNWLDKNDNIISTENPLLVTISSDTTLTANFEYICDKKFKFYIRASTHPLLNPRWRNYPIPIYIKAEENISGAIIEQLVIEIDRTLFNPHRVGYLTSRDNGFMIFENIPVPNLIANEEQLLFNIWGDIMLGNKDSSGILVSSAKFSDDLNVDLEFIAGYLTIEICRAGGDRLLRWFDYVPAVLVKNNPVTSEILKVECRTIEIGNYSLEVIDLLGHTTIIKDWEVTPTTTDLIFNFDIPIDNFNFTSGNYLLVMHTPTSRYITKFVISK